MPAANDEAELMASMGLPTSLRACTAEGNGDDYEVWSADPSHKAESLAIHDATSAASPSASPVAEAASTASAARSDSGAALPPDRVAERDGQKRTRSPSRADARDPTEDGAAPRG